MAGNDEDAADLQPTFAEGFKLGEKKTVDQYAQLDANDESLARWKASLGITGAAAATGSGPNVVVHSLFLTSPTRPQDIVFDLANKAALDGLKKNPVTIKEGVEYNVGITFNVNHSIISGLRYIHIVKRSGIKVDKLEQMLGSYGPAEKPYTSNFPTEESPSGMLARSGTYNVKSRVIDDDGEVYAEFEWAFKLGKEW